MARSKTSLAKTTLDSDNGDMPSDYPKIIIPQSLIKVIGDIKPDEPEHVTSIAHTSFSQMSMYLRCSMQYFFRYVLHLKDKPKVSLSIGKGGHAALEWNTKRKLVTGEDQPVAEVVQKGSDFIDHYLKELPRSEYEKDVEPGDTKDRFLNAIKVFQTRDAPKIMPLSAELAFDFDLNELLPEPLPEPIRIVRGKIDVVSTDTGLFAAAPEIAPIRVEDYKFVTRKRNQGEVNLSPQLTLYAGVEKKITGRWPSKLGYVMLTPGNTKDGPDATFLTREPEHMTPDSLKARLRRLVFQFQQVEKGIRNSVFVPTDDPITCSWCGFRDRCQASLVNDIEAAIIRQSTAPQE